MSGYIYALRPVDMPILKIGSTTNPEERAKVLTAFSPCAMQFTRLIRVKGKQHSLIWEQFALSRTLEFSSHGEWRHESPEVYAVLDAIDGEQCEAGGVFEQRETPRAFLPMDEIEFRLRVADADLYLPGYRETEDVLGLTLGWRQRSANSVNTRRRYRERVEDFLATREPTARAS